MHEPLYREALLKGWQLAWKHKLLWLFGFFAIFLGQMGLSDLLVKIFSVTNGTGFSSWLVIPAVIANLVNGASISLPVDVWVWLCWLFLILVGFFLFFIFMSVVSQGALIKSAAQFAGKGSWPDTNKAWQAGTRHFWRLLGINFVKKIIIIATACFIGYLAVWFLQSIGFGTLGIFLLGFLLAVFVGMMASFLAVYAAGYVVVEEYSFFKSLVSAVKLFFSHWLVSLEVGMIVLLSNLALFVVALLGFAISFLPAVVLWPVGALLGSANVSLSGLVASGLIFLLFFAWLNSVFTVFTTSVWTYLFMKMHRQGIVSRIIHWYNWLGKI